MTELPNDVLLRRIAIIEAEITVVEQRAAETIDNLQSLDQFIRGTNALRRSLRLLRTDVIAH